jgi:flagellar biosynthesis GTPase FlhF
MKIKCFAGTDMRQAFRKVCDTPGPYADILSDHSLEAGVEVIATEHNLPLAYLSESQQVPEDLHPARIHDLVSCDIAIMRDIGVGASDNPISTMIGEMAARAHG